MKKDLPLRVVYELQAENLFSLTSLAYIQKKSIVLVWKRKNLCQQSPYGQS